MESQSSGLIWYASYGSNLNRARFLTYIIGGSPPGSAVEHMGCRDKTLPVADMALRLPRSLYFAGWAPNAWGGSAGAFISHQDRGETTMARAYLITAEQFKDVVQQENKIVGEVGALDLDINGAVSKGRVRMLDEGYYTELIYCGDKDSYPVLSFTASEDRTDHNPPSQTYLKMIYSGLKEAHGLIPAEAASYFSDRAGVVGRYTVSQLKDLFSS
jgi:hypothetical protein